MTDRKLDLNSRNENGREISNNYVLEFSLDEIKEHFDEGIIAIKDQFKVVDREHANAEKRSISKELVEKFIEDIEKIVEAICLEVRKYEEEQKK